MKIAIIGIGNMGSIYARSFVKYDIVKAENLFLVSKNQIKDSTLEGSQIHLEELKQIQPEIVFLCIKPQDYPVLKEQLQEILSAETILVSIMAGITIKQLKHDLGLDHIVKAMPNSPVEIGMGITGFSVAEKMGYNQIKMVENILATTGRTIYFEDEDDLNAVTAVSGSGPAYFFYIIKHMIDAAKEMGFSESVATTLVKQTMLGSFHLYNHSGKNPDELISVVASKKGTTEAAINTFNSYQMDKAIREGMKNAALRAKALNMVLSN